MRWLRGELARKAYALGIIGERPRRANLKAVQR
jgi:hypothetical protein